jgi:hypothetical protein
MFRHEGKVVCIMSVASDGASMCFAHVGKGTPHIVYTKRTLLPLEERTDEQAGSAVMQLLDTMLKEVASRFVPERVHVVVHAPWSQFHTTSHSVTFEKEQSITKALIDETARTALEGITTKDTEAGVMRVFLNGYPTERPLGKRAHSLETIVFGGAIEQGLRSALEHVVGTYYTGREVTFRTGARVLLSAIHEHVPDTHRFIALSVRGSSECMVVRHESETQYASTPEGVESILKRIAPQGLPEETLSRIKMTESDACSTDACAAIKDTVARVEPELVRVFGDMFATLANVRRLPNDMLLFTPPELTPWLSQFFSRIDFSQFTATTQPFDVSTITTEDMGRLVSFDAGVAPDATLAIATAAVHMFEE